MPDAFQKHSAFLTLHAKRKKVLIFLLFDFHIFSLDDTTCRFVNHIGHYY